MAERAQSGWGVRKVVRPMLVRLRVLLPGLWLLITLGSYRYPGDEYGMLVGGSIAGFWPLMLWQPFGLTLDRAMPVVLGVGTTVVFLLGWFADWWRVRVWLWLALWAPFAVVFAFWMLSSYPTLARAISKNGSIAAYVLCSANLALYLTVLAAIVVTPIFGLHRTRPKRGACPSCGYSLHGAPGPRCPECGTEVRGLLFPAGR